MPTTCPGVWLNRTASGIPVLHIHYSADPEKDETWAARERAKFTAQAFWDKEMEMKAHALDGQVVYPEFNPAIHVIPDSEVPRQLCRYMSIDPHPRTPHAMLWVGLDRWGDLYAYRELWPSVVSGVPRQLKDIEQDNSYTVKEYAWTIAWLEGNEIEWRHPESPEEEGLYREKQGGEKLIYRFMDQAGKAFKASDEATLLESYSRRYDRYGIQCSDPRKSHQAGEDAIRELLKPRRHETKGTWPKLHIAASLVELQMEFRRHRYKATRRLSEEKEVKQQGVEARRHLLDNLRYLATADLTFLPNLVS